MPSIPGLSALTSTTGIITGVGVGTAAAAAIEPLVEPAKQQAWKNNPFRILDAGLLARLVAQGGIDLGTAETDALLDGFQKDKLDALVYLAQTVPGFAEAMTVWRRQGKRPNGFDALFAHTLTKAGYDTRYPPFLEDLFDEWLTPAQVALAIVRGLINDPGLMAVTLDAGPGNVTAYTPSTIDALAEALGGGVDKERLRVMVGSIGLPMSTQQAASGFFRSILTRSDYNRSILEGDVRPEWADAILEQSRQILTAGEYAELELRGYYDRTTRLANTAKHGMSNADSDLLYNVLGRGLSLHQMVIGKARGGTFNGDTSMIPADELESMQRGNIRPAYYSIAWHGRYAYPTGFQIKAEAVAGNLTPAQTEQILLELGWDPKWATHFSQAWQPKSAVAAKQKKQTATHLIQEYLSGALTPTAVTASLEGLGYTAQEAADEIALAEFNVAKSARTKAITALEKRYVGLHLSNADATSALQALGLPIGAVDNLLVAWALLRGAALTTLTVSDITKALKAGTMLASEARPLLQDLGEDDTAIATLIATSGANPAT